MLRFLPLFVELCLRLVITYCSSIRQMLVLILRAFIHSLGFLRRGFLGEGDRVYLARRAFNLIQPTLLIWLNQLSRSLSGNMQNLLAAVAHSGHVDDPSVAPQALSSSDPSQMGSFINLETLTQIYRLHCVSYSRNCLPGVSPNRTNKESSPSGGPNDGPSSLGALEISGFAEVLTLAYRLCPSAWVSLTDL